MQPTEWIEQQIEVLIALSGQTIASWRGVEMVFHGGENDEPAVFEHPAFPFLQFHRLEALLDTGSTCDLSTYQNDFVWGLCRYLGHAPLQPEGWDGIYRYAKDPGLPTGLINEVKIWVANTGDIAEVVLGIDSEEILFVAGEVHPSEFGPDQGHVAWLDESVLVFRPPAEADTIAWGRFSSREPIRHFSQVR